MSSEWQRLARISCRVRVVTFSQGRARLLRERAALFAAALRARGPLVRAARLAAALRCASLRRLAALRLWLAIAAREPETRPSRFSARALAAPRRDVTRRDDGRLWPRSKSRS